MSLAAVLTRDPSDDQGTYGTFLIHNVATGSVLSLQSLELPWNHNQPNHSCIPPGEYRCTYVETHVTIRRAKHWYLLSDTSPRMGVLIHIGNYAGEVSKGFVSSTEGGILLGLDRGTLIADGSHPQKAVLESTTACRELVEFTGGAPFQLMIH